MYKKSKLIIFGAVFLIFTATSGFGQTNVYKLHSLFLYNFTKHMQWTNVPSDFKVGVFGSDIALKELEQNLNGKQWGSKNIKVVKISNAQEARACQIVYLPKSDKSKILNLYDEAKGPNVLFVSEEDLTKEGLPVSFIVKNDRLSFKLSKVKIEGAGIKVSSALLSLGTVID